MRSWRCCSVALWGSNVGGEAAPHGILRLLVMSLYAVPCISGSFLQMTANLR